MGDPKRNGSKNPKHLRRHNHYVNKMRDLDPNFGILRWGAGVGRIMDVSESTHGHIVWIRDTSDHGKVKEIAASINYETEIFQYWMGAPSFVAEDFVNAYERKKQEWIQKKKL